MVEYKFYTEVFRGCSISHSEWPMYEARSAEQLNRYKRIYSVVAPEDNSEAMAVCAMADALAFFTAAVNGDAGAVSGASIGSVSVSYGGGSNVDLSQKGQARELIRCARLYLEIYRGVGEC